MSSGYALDQCGLFALKSHRQLAARLNRSEPFIQQRAKADLYRQWNEPKKSGGTRLIEAPRADLKAIQRRIADLLQRVAPPEFLFSPVKGRSYVDNAVAHAGAREVRLLDIVDYFGRCTAQSVFDFFRSRMRCAPDVAFTLTSLTTRNGHLPQGSPCSPILSFYSCFAMWEQIAALVRAADCRITVYVDDITISGLVVPEDMVWRVKQILRRNGHEHSRPKERRLSHRPAEVTGLIVGEAQLCVPHRHYRKLLDARSDALTAEKPEDRSRASARAKSLEVQVQMIHRRKAAAYSAAGR